MNNKTGDFEMQLNIKKVEVQDEAQQTNEKTNTETNETGQIELPKRDMNHIEKALLQNQKALSQTLDQIQNRFTKTLNDLLHSNATLSNRIIAVEMQIRGLHVRMAMLQGNGATSMPIENTGS